MWARLIAAVSALFLFAQPALAENVDHLTQAQIDRYNALTHEANTLADRYIIIEGHASSPPNGAELTRALTLYDEALAIHDGRYGVWWMRGKVYQVQQRPREAFDSFRRAYELAPNEQVIVNEMTIEAVEVGELEFALEATRRGLAVFPNDLALRARLALVQLLRGQLDEAIAAADHALVIAPNDRISSDLRRIAQDVRAGRRTQPSSIQELERGPY